MTDSTQYLFLVTSAVAQRAYQAESAADAIHQHELAHPGRSGEEVLAVLRLNPVEQQRVFALVTDQGTAISESVLTEEEFTEYNKAQAKENAPLDWDGGEFHDVTDNEALNPSIDLHGSIDDRCLPVIDAGFATLHYVDGEGKTWTQPLADLVHTGTLVDPENGDDMPVTGVSFKNQSL